MAQRRFVHRLDGVGGPLLDLGQDWQRQRTQLRHGHHQQRPPPLVTAGIELVYHATAQPPRQVQVAGLALVFGIFPATWEEFVELGRARLRLGREGARQELQGVLGSRIQALWAWLPARAQDCYCEIDHATDDVRTWLIGPEPGAIREVDPVAERADLNAAFIEALVMHGPRHWGGAEGLVRLVRRFGPLSLLVAAQVAEALDREHGGPEVALAAARAHWPHLRIDQPGAWTDLADDEHPWVAVQLGRLALKLGLAEPARRLLDQARRTLVGSVAWGDLAAACAAVDDLPGEEDAAARAAALGADDAAAWRRLVLARAQLGQQREASEALTRLRALGGVDGELVEGAMELFARPHLALLRRAHLAAWLAVRVGPAFAARLPLETLLERIRRQHPAAVLALPAALEQLRVALTASLGPDSGPRDTAVRIVLLALPLLAESPLPVPSRAAAHALLALRSWAERGLGAGGVVDTPLIRRALLALSRIAASESGESSEV
jgi:hypothetical protein